MWDLLVHLVILDYKVSVEMWVLLETLVPKVHQVTRVQRAYEGDKGHLALMESWDRRVTREEQETLVLLVFLDEGVMVVHEAFLELKANREIQVVLEK